VCKKILVYRNPKNESVQAKTCQNDETNGQNGQKWQKWRKGLFFPLLSLSLSLSLSLNFSL